MSKEKTKSNQKPEGRKSYGDYALLSLLGAAGLGLMGLLGLTAKDQLTPAKEIDARVVSVDHTTCGGTKYRNTCAWVYTDKGAFLDDSLTLRGKFSALTSRQELETGCTYKMKVLEPGVLTSDQRILSAEKDKTKPCRKPRGHSA